MDYRAILFHPSSVINYLTRKQQICKLTNSSISLVNSAFEDLRESNLWEYCRSELEPYVDIVPMGTSFQRMKAPIMYVLCRLLKPEVVVETGVAQGVSTTFVLGALEANDRGKLYSIDMPTGDVHGVALVPGKETGWLVPAKLRKRWELRLGRSDDLLPKVCQSVGDIGIFLHDSEHTYKNMMFEFETTWPHIISGGLVLSDDIRMNAAFDDFAISKRATTVHFFDFGAIKKR